MKDFVDGTAFNNEQGNRARKLFAAVVLAALDDAIARANSTPYGLAAYAFTSSQAKATALSRDLHAGMVGINTFMIAHAEAPFGGVDHSGMGREGGREAIRDYQNTKLSHMMAV